jgi:hypothetical protein
MGGPGSGPRPGKGHNAKNFPKSKLASEISGGKYKNLRKALEYAGTPEGKRVTKNVSTMKKIMMKHTLAEARKFMDSLKK